MFTESATGWSGTIAPVAQLAGPFAFNEGHGLAISGQTIFVGSGGYVYVFVEPPVGWSGTIRPSARLRLPGGQGPISASARDVFVDGLIFSEPRSGWRGTVARVAGLYPVYPRGLRGGGGGIVLTGDTAVVGLSQGGKDGCGCPGQVNVFTEPLGGWSGSELSLPAFYTDSATSILPVTLQYPDLFVTGGETVDVYQLSGRYGFKPGPASTSHSRLSGLRSGRPRLRFTIATKRGYPTIQAVTVRLPRGLAFTNDTERLASSVSIASRRPSVSEHQGALVFGAIAPLSTLRITVRSQALTETETLKARVRRLVEHRRQAVLDVKVQTITTPRTNWTSILKLRSG